jgi:hypothetical protein
MAATSIGWRSWFMSSSARPGGEPVTRTIGVAIEAAPKKSFATSVDWPGWSRSGRTEALAIETLAAYAERYAFVPRLAGEAFDDPEHLQLEVVERSEGGGMTEFGVPGAVTNHDRRSVSAAEADRLARIVEAAWRTFDAVVAATPGDLRKGPRGGGRNTTKIVGHVIGSDHGYARELGLRLPEPDPTDAAGVSAIHAAILDVLRRPSDGSPIVRRWTTRYAAHRIAWHALDHAWEIEDRRERQG